MYRAKHTNRYDISLLIVGLTLMAFLVGLILIVGCVV